MDSFNRTPEDLMKNAVLFWPSELAAKEQSTNIIPKLVETQGQFISVLTVADSGPVAWKQALSLSKQLPGNLFLKHLMVLSDIGGEALDRIKPSFSKMFPQNIMKFAWNGKNHEYAFQAIAKTRALGNVPLCVDGPGLIKPVALSPLLEDVCMLLLHGSAILDDAGLIPPIIQERCVVGTLIGKSDEITQFVKERYIWVSRITGGATANTMGQLAQDYVKEKLSAALPGWTVTRNGTIPGISQNAGHTDISFDVVVKSPKNKYCAVEISFQFTTNSVIERKAGQSKSRQEVVHKAGHKIAYVIDGAGNFKRASALKTICNYSDCTVAFQSKELDVLVEFLKKNLT